MNKNHIIDSLVGGGGKITKDILIEWMKQMDLKTSAAAAAALSVNPRTFEGWRSGRFAVHPLFVYRMREYEQSLSK